MNVTIFNTASPLTEEDIDQAEQRIGQPIPAAYRAFLIAHNGGQPDPDGFSSYAENGEVHDQSLVSLFFGLNTGSYYNDLEQHYQLVLEHRVPSDLLPIASDPGGNLICLSVDGSSTGTVYFWDHEFEIDVENGESPTHVNVFFVAKSFEDFLKTLHNYAEEQRSNDQDSSATD